MTYSRDLVVAAYREAGNIRATCAKTGVSPYTAFIWLKQAGVLTLDDKSSYGTRSAKAGAEAEMEFQRLVPDAIPANKHIQNNCPSFDFLVHELSVDVKFSAIRSGGDWGWRMCRHKPLKPDFVVVFLSQGRTISDGYFILLLPEQLFEDRASMSLSQTSRDSFLWDFQIGPDSLSKTLHEASA